MSDVLTSEEIDNLLAALSSSEYDETEEFVVPGIGGGRILSQREIDVLVKALMSYMENADVVSNYMNLVNSIRDISVSYGKNIKEREEGYMTLHDELNRVESEMACMKEFKRHLDSMLIKAGRLIKYQS